jgi:hypothetical protein
MKGRALALLSVAWLAQMLTGMLGADEPMPRSEPLVPAPSNAPAWVGGQFPGAAVDVNGTAMPAPARGDRPIRGWLRNHKWGCWTTHNTLGCGNLQSECVFIFGSCRAFYGEPCLPGPPPSPTELYNMVGRRPSPAPAEPYATGRRGCNCQ